MGFIHPMARCSIFQNKTWASPTLLLSERLKGLSTLPNTPPFYPALTAQLACLALDDCRVLLPSDFCADLAPMTDFGDLVLNKYGGRTICWAEGEERPFEVEHFVPSHDWFAQAEGYTQIGLWLFHLLFSGRSWAGLRLTHARSNVAALYVQVREAKPNDTFLELAAPARYARYSYFPAEVSRHAFADAPMSREMRVVAEDRPDFHFSWSDDAQRQKRNLRAVDQVIVTVTPSGLCALAGLLLDFGRADNAVTEVNLEVPVFGFAGVATGSLEARFWLPGSLGFWGNSLDDLDFPAWG